MSVAIRSRGGGDALTTQVGMVVVAVGVAAGVLAILRLTAGLLVLAIPVLLWVVLRLVAAPTQTVVPLLVLGAIAGAWTPPLLSVGGLNLRLSQVALGLAGCLALLRAGVFVWRPWLWSYAVPAAGMVSLAVVWSLLRSPDLKLATGHVVLLGLNVSTFMMVLSAVGEERSRLNTAVRSIAWGAIGAALWTLVILFGALRGIGAFERLLAPEQLTLVGAEGVSSSLFPRLAWGVVIGSFAASFAVGLAGAAMGTRGPARALMLAGSTAGLLGVLLGVARGPILALGVGVAAFVVGLLLGRRIDRIVQLTLGGAAAVFLVVGAVSQVQTSQFPLRQAVTGKAIQLFVTEEYTVGTAGGRLDVWRPMLADVAQSPLTGQGMDTYRRYVPPAHQASENFPLEMLHATGVPGFACYMALHLLLLATLVRVVGRTRLRSRVAMEALGLGSAHFGLTVASATNPAAGGAIYWALFALAIAASRQALSASSNPPQP